MQTIKIICECGYEWEATVNDKLSCSDVNSYFIGKPFNVGTDENEKIVYPVKVIYKGLDYL